MKTQKLAFTLVELLVVIAIIAILMGVLIPTLNAARESAKRAVCSNQIKQVGVAVITYTSDNDYFMPIYNCDTGKNSPYYLIHTYSLYRADKSQFMDSSGKPLPMKLALLYEGKYIAEPKVFYCPSNFDDLYKFESYNDPKPWGTLPQRYDMERGGNPWVRMGYTYMPIDPTLPKDPSDPWGLLPIESAKKIDRLDPSMPYMTDIFRSTDEKPNGEIEIHLSHKRSNSHALNCLWKDGSVTLFTGDSVFESKGNPWERYEYGEINEYILNYLVFKLIGGQKSPAGG